MILCRGSVSNDEQFRAPQLDSHNVTQ